MRYPSFLQENGTIGFVAPSFGCATEPYTFLFDNALKKFKEMGYKLKLGPNCRIAEGIGISNTPEKCGAELSEFYADSESDILMSCGGGEMMCEVIPYIDFDLIKRSAPKWYMGYSDNTNFTYLSATIADTAAIYGPCVSSCGAEPWHSSISDAFDLLTGKNTVSHGYPMWEKEELPDADPLAPYNLDTETKYKYFIPSKNSDTEFISGDDFTDTVTLEGRLLGGCLDCLTNLPGTPFDHTAEFAEKYKEDGIIWFFESCDLNVFSMRRAIWQLKSSGWFMHVKGFLIGRPYFYGQEMIGLDQYHAICDLLTEYNVPIIMDLDIGHLPPMMPLVTGSYAKVTASGNNITVEHKFI